MAPKISISDAFDGGNIMLMGQTMVNGVITVKLDIKPDVYTHLERIAHMQYFCFRVSINNNDFEDDSFSSVDVQYVIENAAQASYPIAWQGTTVFYSNDLEEGRDWKRNLGTTYVDGKLKWTHSHERNEGSTYFSYFPPFSYSRHVQLISNCASAIRTSKIMTTTARVETLGQTLQGREIDYITCGTGDLVCWIIHRQHPGEAMAEYFAEGLLHRLLGMDKNAIASGRNTNQVTVQKVLEMYTFHIVPCMCLDGAVMGHLRTNSCGANLNREWATKGDYEAPTLERSPEVYHVLKKMDETGVDMFLDIHGDEGTTVIPFLTVLISLPLHLLVSFGYMHLAKTLTIIFRLVR
jgi:murein tripeptide amidase MpaA